NRSTGRRGPARPCRPVLPTLLETLSGAIGETKPLRGSRSHCRRPASIGPAWRRSSDREGARRWPAVAALQGLWAEEEGAAVPRGGARRPDRELVRRHPAEPVGESEPRHAVCVWPAPFLSTRQPSQG